MVPSIGDRILKLRIIAEESVDLGGDVGGGGVLMSWGLGKWPQTYYKLIFNEKLVKNINEKKGNLLVQASPQTSTLLQLIQRVGNGCKKREMNGNKNI